jgi:hypothetical protein
MKTAIAETRITVTIPQGHEPLSRVALHAPGYTSAHEEQAPATAQTLVDISRGWVPRSATPVDREAPDGVRRLCPVGSHVF